MPNLLQLALGTSIIPSQGSSLSGALVRALFKFPNMTSHGTEVWQPSARSCLFSSQLSYGCTHRASMSSWTFFSCRIMFVHAVVSVLDLTL